MRLFFGGARLPGYEAGLYLAKNRFQTSQCFVWTKRHLPQENNNRLHIDKKSYSQVVSLRKPSVYVILGGGLFYYTFIYLSGKQADNWCICIIIIY